MNKRLLSGIKPSGAKKAKIIAVDKIKIIRNNIRINI